MQILKKNTENVEIDSENILNLKIENEKLKIENKTLEFKLEAEQERRSVLMNQISDLKSYDINDLKVKNKNLENQIHDMKFKIENDTSNIELSTENKKLKAKTEIQEHENKYLQELLKTYREMPDVKNLMDNLSSLAVPSIEELKEFSKVIRETKIVQLSDDLKDGVSAIKDLEADIKDLKYKMTGSNNINSRYY